MRYVRTFSQALTVVTLTAACGTGFRSSARRVEIPVVDLMPRFFSFLDSSRKVDSTARSGLFRQMVVAADTQVYAAFTDGPSARALNQYLRTVVRDTASMRVLHRTLAQELPRYTEAFEHHFPDAVWKGVVVYFMPWFYISDAGGGRVGDTEFLIFGLDQIARRGTDQDLGPLFHHELFHLYHARVQSQYRGMSRNQIPFFWQVWTEGLATFVSSRLNPSASMGQIMLDSTMIESVAGRTRALSAEIRERMDSVSDNIHQDYLSGRPRRADLPPRSGYYIGFRVAEKMASRYSLAELARLQPAMVRREMDIALAELTEGRSAPR